MIEITEKNKDNIDLITIKNAKLEVTLSNLGCTILKIILFKADGSCQDVVLGYDDVHDYLKYDGYLGAVVGRVANRIAKGRFKLNNQEYELAINNGPNHLHGGIKGFSYRIFDYRIVDDMTVELSYRSQDGEEGYPGNLDVKVLYTIDGDRLLIRYLAQSDQDTLINLTNHSYFNLDQDNHGIEEHYLQIDATKFACVDGDGLATGEIENVAGTTFDFTRLGQIKDHLAIYDKQLELGNGIDHHFIFKGKKNQVSLVNPDKSLQLIVSTSLPGAQIYTANYLDGRMGKNGQSYPARFGVCIETQNMPDAIHIEKNPTTILKKGQRYDEFTSYQFIEL